MNPGGYGSSRPYAYSDLPPSASLKQGRASLSSAMYRNRPRNYDSSYERVRTPLSPSGSEDEAHAYRSESPRYRRESPPRAALGSSYGTRPSLPSTQHTHTRLPAPSSDTLRADSPRARRAPTPPTSSARTTATAISTLPTSPAAASVASLQLPLAHTDVASRLMPVLNSHLQGYMFPTHDDTTRGDTFTAKPACPLPLARPSLLSAAPAVPPTHTLPSSLHPLPTSALHLLLAARGPSSLGRGALNAQASVAADSNIAAHVPRRGYALDNRRAPAPTPTATAAAAGVEADARGQPMFVDSEAAVCAHVTHTAARTTRTAHLSGSSNTSTETPVAIAAPSAAATTAVGLSGASADTGAEGGTRMADAAIGATASDAEPRAPASATSYTLRTVALNAVADTVIYQHTALPLPFTTTLPGDARPASNASHASHASHARPAAHMHALAPRPPLPLPHTHLALPPPPPPPADYATLQLSAHTPSPTPLASPPAPAHTARVALAPLPRLFAVPASHEADLYQRAGFIGNGAYGAVYVGEVAGTHFPAHPACTGTVADMGKLDASPTSANAVVGDISGAAMAVTGVVDVVGTAGVSATTAMAPPAIGDADATSSGGVSSTTQDSSATTMPRALTVPSRPRVALKGSAQTVLKEGFPVTQLREIALSRGGVRGVAVTDVITRGDSDLYAPCGGDAGTGARDSSPASGSSTTASSTSTALSLPPVFTTQLRRHLSAWPVVPLMLALLGVKTQQSADTSAAADADAAVDAVRTAKRKLLSRLALRLPVVLPMRFRSGAPVSLVFPYYPHDLYGLMHVHRLQPRMVMDRRQAKYLLHQLLLALCELERAGVVHRDLKGSNILVDNAGAVALADYGLARQRQAQMEGLGYTNRVVTIWYRAPELLIGSTAYGTGVDVWAAGCLFAELLCNGRPLFQGPRQDLDQLRKIVDVLGVPAPSREAAEAAETATLANAASEVSPSSSGGSSGGAGVKMRKVTREGVVKSVASTSTTSATAAAGICRKQVWREFHDLFRFDDMLSKGGSLGDVFRVSMEEDVVAERVKVVESGDVDAVEKMNPADGVEDGREAGEMADQDVMGEEDALNDAAEPADMDDEQVLEAATDTSADTSSVLDSEHVPITPLGFALLQSMLTMDPQQRPLASQLVSHPYFTEYPPLFDRDTYIRLYGNKYGQEEWHELRFR